MPTLTIRNLPPEVIERLKRRAKRHGNSMEQEARNILGEQLPSKEEVLAKIQENRKKIKNPPSAEDVNRWIAISRGHGDDY